jgi:hypothetical protein
MLKRLEKLFLNKSIMIFKKQLIQLGKLLQADKRIEIVKFEVGKIPSNSEWANLQRGTCLDGILFPQQADYILRDINGYHLEWIVRDDNLITPHDEKFPDKISGRICIYDPAHLIGMYVFEEWKDTLHHHAESDFPNEDLNLIPFDYYHPDYSACACFRIQNGLIDPYITFHSSRFGFYYSSLNFEEYLSFLLVTGGMLDSREGLFFNEGLERHKLLHYVPQIFPHSPIKKIVSKLDEMNTSN